MKIASALEAHFSEVADAEPETLAHHYTAAGLSDQAIAYWQKAGQRALKRSANVEALAHFNRGLEAAAALTDPDNRLRQELTLQSAIGVAAMAVKGWGAQEVLKAFSTARKLSEQLGDSNEQFIAVRGEASYHMMSGNLAVADELGEQCLRIAKVSRNRDFLLEAHHQCWATKLFMGDYSAAEAHADIGRALYDPERDHRLTYIYTGHDPGVCCRNNSAQLLWLRGYPDQALERVQEAVALAEREAHSVTLAIAQSTMSHMHLLRREPVRAREWAEKQLDTSTRFGIPLVAAHAQFHRGSALAQQGRVEGLNEMRKGIDGIAATGADMGMHVFLCTLAQACGQLGEAKEGLALVEKALAMTAKSGTKHLLSELLRAKGELLSLRDQNG